MHYRLLLGRRATNRRAERRSIASRPTSTRLRTTRTTEGILLQVRRFILFVQLETALLLKGWKTLG
jgi:hypothetical protein